VRWQSTWQCSCPSTPSPRLIRSKVPVTDLRRAPARCSIRPLHRPKNQVAACSRGDASHGLFVTSPCRLGASRYGTARGRTICKTACRAPGRITPELSGSATSAWVKMRASIRAHGLGVVPVLHTTLGLSYEDHAPSTATTDVLLPLLPPAARHSITRMVCSKAIGGLAKSLGGTLRQPAIPPTHVDGRVWPWRCVFTPVRAHATMYQVHVIRTSL